MTAVGFSILLGITLLFLLLFAGIEIAFVSANRLGVELKKKQGKRSGILLSHFFENGNAFLGVCIAGIVLFLVLFILVLIHLLASYSLAGSILSKHP